MKLIPRDEFFFNLIEKQADSAQHASKLLKEIVTSWETKKIKIPLIKEFERDCDSTTDQIMDKINRTFVTPLDREDIYLLAKRLASLVDLIQKVGSRLDLFQISSPTADLIEFVSILTETSQFVFKAIQEIRHLKKPQVALEYCNEINHLENLADNLMEKALKNIFEKFSAIEVIKWKEIYDFCEQAINRCEDIGNTVEAIVVKYG